MINNKRITKSNLLSGKEAAEMLEVSETHLRSFANRGLITRVKDKVDLSKTYYLKSDLENFLDTRYYLESE